MIIYSIGFAASLMYCLPFGTFYIRPPPFPPLTSSGSHFHVLNLRLPSKTSSLSILVAAAKKRFQVHALKGLE